jgi:hypothetical protein
MRGQHRIEIKRLMVSVEWLRSVSATRAKNSVVSQEAIKLAGHGACGCQGTYPFIPFGG